MQQASLLGDLLSVCPEGANVLGAAFRGDPHQATRGDWFAHKAAAGTVWETNAGAELNKYLCVSAFSDVVRRKDTFVAQLALMIDDVGGEIDTAKVPATLEPTWTIETSPGNYQLWYVFSDPITDRAVAEGLVGALQAKGFSKADGGDTGFAGVTRYGRCDRGVNAKPEAKLWRVTGRRTGGLVTVAQVMDAFGVTEKDLRRRKKGSVGGTGPQSDLELAEAMEGDTLAKWLAEQGLVKRWRDDGWLDITCPWVEEHTGGADNGTAYRLARFSGSGRGGFKCHHGSHIDRTLADLWAWAEAEGWQNPWAVPDAVDEFEPLDVTGGRAWRRAQLAEAHVWVRNLGLFFDLDKGITESSEHLEMSIQQYAKDKEVDVAVGKNAQRLYGYLELDGEDKDGKPKKSFFRIGTWLRDVQGRVVDKLTWDPRESRLFTRNGVTYANDYKPLPKFVAKEGVKPWLDIIKAIYPDDVETILDWLGYTVKYPGEKIQHALVLGGVEGAGKNCILNPFEKQEGYCSSDVGIDDLMGSFNEFLYGRKMVFVNEAKRTKQHNTSDVHNNLKKLISTPPDDLTIKRKYLGEAKVPNVLSVAILTNYLDGLHISRGDRRYKVLWTDVVPPPELVQGAYRWINAGGWREVFAFLQARDVSGFNPNDAPVWTEAQHVMFQAGQNDMEILIEDALEGLDVVGIDSLLGALWPHFSDRDRPGRRQAIKVIREMRWIKLPGTDSAGRWKVKGTMEHVFHRPGLSKEQIEKGLEKLRKTD